MLYRKFPLICQIFIELFVINFFGCSTPASGEPIEIGGTSSTANPKEIVVSESGRYTTKDSVAAYICKFDKLPQNYVGKTEGQKLYESSTGNSFSKWNFNPWKTLGVMIGGDSFSNSEKLLPSGTYHEADVDYGSVQSRGTKRLVYQTGCIIYYTADHYESFSKINF